LPLVKATALQAPKKKEAMATTTQTELKDAIRMAAHPLTGAATDYNRLLSRIGDASFVLIGEASHGTHDFTTNAPESRNG
jgi:erythromycin esterase-like protein